MMTMPDAIVIRPAQPTDDEIAGALLYSAYIHTKITYPLEEPYESGFIEHLRDFFRQEGNRFSYQFTQLALHGTEVVGLVLSFAGRDEARLNAAAGSWLKREAEDDEWYVDALAVLKPWGHQGIGTRLLQSAEQQARQQHYPQITLNVAQGNKEALDLYTHLHYVTTKQTLIYQQPHMHMTKFLKNAE